MHDSLRVREKFSRSMFSAMRSRPAEKGLLWRQRSSSVTPWYPFYLSALIIAELFCALGLWNMQKWAAYLYCAILGAMIAVGLSLGTMGLIPTLLSGYAIVTMLYFAKRMR